MLPKTQGAPPQAVVKGAMVPPGMPSQLPGMKGPGMAYPFYGPTGSGGSSYPLGISGTPSLLTGASGAPGAHSAERTEMYEVVYKVVALRSGPSIESKLLARLDCGNRISGVIHWMGKEPWLRLAPQKLQNPANIAGKSTKEIRPEDEVWALIDASNANLGLGVLLQKVEDTLIPEQDMTDWKVVHSKVAFRKEGSLTAPLVGYHSRGDRLQGVTQMVGGVPWLKSNYKDANGTTRLAWTLIDGATFGLGRLLKEVYLDGSSSSDDIEGTGVSANSKNGKAKAQAKSVPKAKAAEPKAKEDKTMAPKENGNKPTAPTAKAAEPKGKDVEPEGDPSGEVKSTAKAKAKASVTSEATAQTSTADEPAAKAKAKAKQGPGAKAKAKAKQVQAAELGDLSRWIYHEYGRQGRFKVVHHQVVMRNLPSTKAKMKGLVLKGDFVQGEQRDEWLLLDHDITPLELLEGNGRWLLIDGKSAGFDMLLERVGDPRPADSAYQPGSNGPTETETKPPGERLPRVLCLPGAASGKDIFNVQLRFLTRRAQGMVEFVFIDGPRDCTDPEPVKIMSSFFRGKPMKMLDEFAFDEKNWLTYKQPRAALKWLQEKLQEHGPIDAVLGFSQGADFATMLAAQASKNVGVPLACVVLLCPHAPGYMRYLEDLFGTEVKVPAFVSRGLKEDYDEGMKETLRNKVIDKMGYKMPSEHVIRLFRDTEVVTHPDDHRPVPQDKQEAEKLAERLLAFVVRHARKPAAGQQGGAPASDEFRDGASVRLIGLEKVAHLNQQEGTLQRWDTEAERWVVSLQTGEQVMLRERNLEIVKDQCVVCDQAVGFKKSDDGKRYCAKCWITVACKNCRKAVGSERGGGKDLYCEQCWAKRMCVKCTTAFGEVQSSDGDKYCKGCWEALCCSECKKDLATKRDKESQFCGNCWLAKVCNRCDIAIATIKDPSRGHRFCAECWDLSSCIKCRLRLGEVRDVKRDNYCAECWDVLSCVICLKAAGSVKDPEGRQHCQPCWEKHRLCVRCKTELGTLKLDGKQYCADCHYVITLCVRCGEAPGEPKAAEKFLRFCVCCWAARERELLEQAKKGQGQLFRDLLGASEASAGPPLLPSAPGPPELPREAGAFLRRLRLGPGPEGHEVPDPEDSLRPAPRPQPSPVQGTSVVDSGSGWSLEFTSAFDSGNASLESLSLEPAKGGLPTFFLRVAPDVKANSASLRAFDQARQYWFYFGVTPTDPIAAIGARFRLKVGGMMRQEDMFDNGYAPLCHTPSAPIWRRVEEGSVECKREKDESGEAKNTMAISWLHTIEGGDIGGTTYFAFCYPFSFGDMQCCLSRLEHAVEASLRGEEPSLLGCLHQVHAGCTYTPFGEHSLEPPRVGKGIYFHRQLFARSPQGRTIEMLTITEAPADPVEMEAGPRDPLPKEVQDALKGWPSAPPLRFEKQICFASGRVHPGETPGQFAFLGLLQFLLSDDPRAALLRKKFVFKLMPMMNPDGVSWGHSRTNSLGFDLNRCYAQPTAEEHDVVFSVKVQLIEWKKRGGLCWYTDMHAHGKDRGCFLYGNLQESEEEFYWSVAYGHAVQLNCPHLDIDKCLWSTAPAPKTDQPDYDSGRGQIGRCCKIPLAYTLECNYNTGRLCRPVPEPPSLAPHFVGTQTVRDCGVPRDPAAGGRFAPVSYDPCHWATVGEALAVSILDMQAENPHSRLLVGRPPKLIVEVGGRTSAERAHQQDVLRQLDEVWEHLTRRHRAATLAARG